MLAGLRSCRGTFPTILLLSLITASLLIQVQLFEVVPSASTFQQNEQETEGPTHCLSVQSFPNASAVLFPDYRLIFPSIRIAHFWQAVPNRDVVITLFLKVCIVTGTYLRHPFYTFVSIHAP